VQTGLYVALSSQVALERRLNTIADNVANATTTGFRATGVKFEDVVTGSRPELHVLRVVGHQLPVDRRRAAVQTGNPLDFAVRGDAWFAIQTPEGPVMTRDGRFTMQPDGQLVSIEGHPVLDAGGGEILLNPEGGTPTVAADGAIRQDGQLVGAIGLFDFQPGNDFRRYGNSGVIPRANRSPSSTRRMSASSRAISKARTSIRCWRSRASSRSSVPSRASPPCCATARARCVRRSRRSAREPGDETRRSRHRRTAARSRRSGRRDRRHHPP
jgi:flagellar basal-body rod protein FlgF